jgi:hypothetical protein
MRKHGFGDCKCGLNHEVDAKKAANATKNGHSIYHTVNQAAKPSNQVVGVMLIKEVEAA